MKILSLKYEDLSTGWKLDLTEFNSHLTLLVGVSGVGKTRVLQAILNLQKLVYGEWELFIQWDIKFSTEKGKSYQWLGKNSQHKISTEEFVDYIRSIEYEKLYIDRELVVDRTANSTIFNEKETVKLPDDKSIIYFLKEEAIIKDIYYAFDKIIYNEIGKHFTYQSSFFPLTKEKLKIKINKYNTLDSIRNSNECLSNKLYFLYVNDKQAFDFLVDIYIDIFPYVEGLKIVLHSSQDLLSEQADEKFYPHIGIKERNVIEWIRRSQLSSGMLKTFIQLTEIYLAPDDSVILIDEFENSLGINCINEVTSSILASERNLQFIITSHHPYIINNIPIPYWKVVTRNGNIVKTTDAEKLGVGRSKHQAFTQLANLNAYSEGIES